MANANSTPQGPTMTFHVVGIETAESSSRWRGRDRATTCTPRRPSSGHRRGGDGRDRHRIPTYDCVTARPTSLGLPPRSYARTSAVSPGARTPSPRPWRRRSTPRRWGGGCWPCWPAWPGWPSSDRHSVARASSRARSTPRWRPSECPGATSSCWARRGIWWWRSSVPRRQSSCRLRPVPAHPGRRGTSGRAFHRPLLRPRRSSARGVGHRRRGAGPGRSGRRCGPRGCDIGDDRALDTHPSSIVAQVAAAGAPASAVIGVRHALERGRGAASVPVGTALFGTALAVLALCATAVFGASLSHLTATPALYGEDYQVLFANNTSTGGNPATEVAYLEHDRAITGIMTGIGTSSRSTAPASWPSPERPFEGHCSFRWSAVICLPEGGTSHLGTTTLRQVGAHLGFVVHVTVQVPGGGRVPHRFVSLGRHRSLVSSGSAGWASGPRSPSRASRTPCARPDRRRARA